MASLLRLQAGRSPHPEVLEVLENTRHRVHSMALLHEALYRSDNLARINFATYVEELCRHLRRSAGAVMTRVTLENKVAPPGPAPGAVPPLRADYQRAAVQCPETRLPGRPPRPGDRDPGAGPG